MRREILKAGIILSALLLSLAYAANNVGSETNANQALDQLRILQKQMGASDSATDNSASNGQDLKSDMLFSTKSTQNKSSVLSSMAPPTEKGANVKTLANRRVETKKEVVLSATEPTTGLDVVDEEAIDEAAFESVKKQMFPMSPDQVLDMKQTYQTNEFAQAAPVGTPPKPTATSQMVNLSPGSTPPVIRLSQGFVSSLVFLDSTGAPWPISAYDLGDPASFNIQWDKTSNTLMIQSLKLYTYGNLAVRLKDLNTPVMLTLIPGQKAVDYRVDLRIQGYGPNATNLPLGTGLPSSADDVLLHVLDGVPPTGSTRLTVSGGDARAWLLNEKMFVRTNLTVLSPGWIGSMTSADGMHAYEMQKSPVLLVSWHGKVMQLKVEGL